MTFEDRSLPDITAYIDLIDSFLRRAMTAADFALLFLRMMKSEPRILGDRVYPVLQELFEDADAHVADPELPTEPGDIDNDQLLLCAERARKALREVGYQ